MKDRANRFPVDGSSALRLYDESAATRIIDFPLERRRPLHARRDDALEADRLDSRPAHRLARKAMDSEMVDSLLHGTCAGKSLNKVTPLQAAGICLFFFFAMLATLPFA